MTPEQELELLIEQQRRDDTHVVWPQRGVAFSLDATTPEGDRSFADVIGVDLEGEIHVFLPRRRGTLLGAGWHGTVDGYTNHLCHCARCRRAWADHTREYRLRRKRTDPTYAERKNTYERAWRRKRNPLKTLECPGCHEEFEQRITTQLYCSKGCKDAAWWRNKRASLRAAA